MKLVEILARELKEWPEEAFSAVQDNDTDDTIWFLQEGHKPVWNTGDEWVCESWFDILISRPTRLSSDHETAIVTRADWEAERARIAKTAKKTNKDGWIRHRGGKCPVEAGVLVEVRNRSGDIAIRVADSCTSVSWHWSHDRHNGDIMAYRMHKPAEQPAIEPAVVANVQAFNERAEMRDDSKVVLGAQPLKWRDRITEIDASVEALEEERAALVQRLEVEGFRLIERVNAGLADAMQAHESSWPEDAPSIDSAPDWATHIGRDKCGYHWFDHKPEKYDSDVFVKGLLGLNGYREGRHKKAKDMENNLELWSCKILALNSSPSK